MKPLVFLLLLTLPIFAQAQTFIGYGFFDNRDANITLLGLGVNRYNQTVVCIQGIQYLPNMSQDGQIISRTTNPTWLVQSFSGSATPGYCFTNYTCELRLPNGSIYSITSSNDMAATLLNHTGITTQQTYEAQCTIYTSTGNATTDQRTLTVLYDGSEEKTPSLLFLSLVILGGGLAVLAILNNRQYSPFKVPIFMLGLLTILIAINVGIGDFALAGLDWLYSGVLYLFYLILVIYLLLMIRMVWGFAQQQMQL